MSTTVTYKGSTLTTAENQTRTLKTAGKYMEADVVITDVTSGGGGGTVNTCTMVIDENDGVTCTNFSDHTPTGQYIAIAIFDDLGQYGKNSLIYFSGINGDCQFLALSDVMTPMAWGGYLVGVENGATVYDTDVYDGATISSMNISGTYTATVIDL